MTSGTPTPAPLDVILVIDSSLTTSHRFTDIWAKYLSNIIPRLQHATPTSNVRIGLVSYTKAGTKPSPILKSLFFMSLEHFIAQFQSSPAELGLGRSSMASASRMAVLEGLVAALEMHDLRAPRPPLRLKASNIMKSPLTKLKTPQCHIILIASHLPGVEDFPVANRDPKFDGTTWDSLPNEIRKRKLQFSVVLGMKMPKISELYSKAVDHQEKPWFPVAEPYLVLLGPRKADGGVTTASTGATKRPLTENDGGPATKKAKVEIPKSTARNPPGHLSMPPNDFKQPLQTQPPAVNVTANTAIATLGVNAPNMTAGQSIGGQPLTTEEYKARQQAEMMRRLQEYGLRTGQPINQETMKKFVAEMVQAKKQASSIAGPTPATGPSGTTPGNGSAGPSNITTLPQAAGIPVNRTPQQPPAAPQPPTTTSTTSSNSNTNIVTPTQLPQLPTTAKPPVPPVNATQMQQLQLLRHRRQLSAAQAQAQAAQAQAHAQAQAQAQAQAVQAQAAQAQAAQAHAQAQAQAQAHAQAQVRAPTPSQPQVNPSPRVPTPKQLPLPQLSHPQLLQPHQTSSQPPRTPTPALRQPTPQNPHSSPVAHPQTPVQPHTQPDGSPVRPNLPNAPPNPGMAVPIANQTHLHQQFLRLQAAVGLHQGNTGGALGAGVPGTGIGVGVNPQNIQQLEQLQRQRAQQQQAITAQLAATSGQVPGALRPGAPAGIMGGTGTQGLLGGNPGSAALPTPNPGVPQPQASGAKTEWHGQLSWPVQDMKARISKDMTTFVFARAPARPPGTPEVNFQMEYWPQKISLTANNFQPMNFQEIQAISKAKNIQFCAFFPEQNGLPQDMVARNTQIFQVLQSLLSSKKLVVSIPINFPDAPSGAGLVMFTPPATKENGPRIFGAVFLKDPIPKFTMPDTIFGVMNPNSANANPNIKPPGFGVAGPSSQPTQLQNAQLQAQMQQAQAQAQAQAQGTMPHPQHGQVQVPTNLTQSHRVTAQRQFMQMQQAAQQQHQAHQAQQAQQAHQQAAQQQSLAAAQSLAGSSGGNTLSPAQMQLLAAGLNPATVAALGAAGGQAGGFSGMFNSQAVQQAGLTGHTLQQLQAFQRQRLQQAQQVQAQQQAQQVQQAAQQQFAPGQPQQHMAAPNFTEMLQQAQARRHPGAPGIGIMPQNVGLGPGMTLPPGMTREMLMNLAQRSQAAQALGLPPGTGGGMGQPPRM